MPKISWLLTLCTTLALAQSPAPKLHTTQGEATGTFLVNGTQKAFLGIPYAAPPVGNLRWKAPQPPAAWKGTRDATHFGARCEQWHIWNDYLFLDPGPSEDCLFLNIYAPASSNPSSKLPIMVWVHGGGFAAGASSEPRYTNSALPSHNVILVTLNYRLNVFGFLANDDLAKEGNGHAGNYGLMDIAAALQWVRANATNLGGDPQNITLFGESAGSFAINALMAAPSAQKLFQKAIGESGAFFNNTIPMPTVADRAKSDQAFTEALGAHGLAELRALPAETVLAAASKQSVVRFSPVIDGQFLTESIATTYAAGRQSHIPTIIGWNRDERAGTLSKDMTAEKWKAYAAAHFGDQATQFFAAFPATTDAEAVHSADAYTTAGYIAFGAWRWADLQASTGKAPVYRYRFDLGAPASEMHPVPGYAWHSDELEYVFGTLDTRVGATWRPEDRALSQQIITYWTNFAHTGNPNSSGLPNWPRFDQTQQTLHLDNPTNLQPDTARPQFEFLLNAKPPTP